MTPRRVFVLAAALMLGSTGLLAADQVVFGKKLLIKNPPSGAAGNKVVHLGKDPGIIVGAAGSASDPTCTGAGSGGASSLQIIASGGAGNITIPLPCVGWTKSGDLYKYKDTSGPTCKIVIVKGGTLVKAVCKGAQIAIDLNGSMSPVAVVTTLNQERYCTTFGGSIKKDGSDDKTFLRKDAPAPFACPTTTTTLPGTCCNLDGGSCFSIEDQSDADACAGLSGTPASGVCDAATGTCQGSSTGGESACCRDAEGIPCADGPGVSQSVCESLGGVYALDSCADGCDPGGGGGSTSTTFNTATTTITTTSETSTSSTTSTTIPVCCGAPWPGYTICAGGISAAACTGAGGTPGAPGTVCDTSTNCVAPPGTPGDCCEFPGGQCGAPYSESLCTSGGTFHPNAVCLENGMCSP